MVKAYHKTFFRSFISNIVRFLTISSIIAIGICVVTAITGLPEAVKDSIDYVNNTQLEIIQIEIIADKIEIISYIFPTFFIIVSSLTVFTTITRYIEEDRSNMACLKTLGYSTFSIIFKYILFALICSLCGCIVGVLLGNYTLLPLLFEAMKGKFYLIELTKTYMFWGLIWSIIMCIVITLISTIVSIKNSRGNLVQPKTIKSGGKIFLEKIKFIWNPLKFKYKSTARNIFRFKGRLIMTLLSVAGATALIFCGFGLYASLNSIKELPASNMDALIDSMLPISIAIIICALLLCALVLFNLTNINIEERKREIATLKVLGYKLIEVAWYIYREVFILSFIGIAIGIPVGYYFLDFLFKYLEFGSIDDVNIFVYFYVVGVALLSLLLADFFLYFKINKIEMVTSLKTIE